MDSVHVMLADIWLVLLGLILSLYVVLDGFDLGVGVLSLFAGDEQQRSVMMASLGSVWDANETWLVLLGGALFGAFPVAYGAILSGLYIPIMAMVFALIFRAVAFEFRELSGRKLFWNTAFGLGSLIAALAQGYALGALIDGVPIAGYAFTGGVWGWFTPFSSVVALGVAFGYTLLGAAYLNMKTEGELQRVCRRRAQVAAAMMLVAAVVVTIRTPVIYPHVAQKWFSVPWVFYIAPLPVFAVFAFLMLLRALRRAHESSPFFWSIGIFAASLVGLAISLYPFIIPGYLTVGEAAASSATLVFMLTGVGMLIPIMLVYNGYQYLVFRGKVHAGGYGDETHG